MAAYEFTTLTCVPGVVRYNGAKIQLLDLPGIIEGAKDGKGRGRQVNEHLMSRRQFTFYPVGKQKTLKYVPQAFTAALTPLVHCLVSVLSNVASQKVKS